MKRLIHSLPFLLIATAVVLFTASCSKDGNTGPAGQQGPKGDKGDTGTANIIYSDWLDIPFKADTVHTAGNRIDTLGYFANIDAPKLTTSILNSGELKVYINLNSAADPLITPLPYTDLRTGVYIRYIAYKQTIELYSNLNAGTVQNNAGVKMQQYRYILIPGGTKARKANVIDWNNYNAVKDYLGLKN
ncbi:hypothetical protein [Chitinophaga sp. HK235]|uniref:hypothetical protein n=1 Tax=Chitinophaga sp. HK235 TaxID=2952571 RepID=UPI001BA72017|nr:hypothetical protein [Chitinophaga sp. HK235]